MNTLIGISNFLSLYENDVKMELQNQFKNSNHEIKNYP